SAWSAPGGGIHLPLWPTRNSNSARGGESDQDLAGAVFSVREGFKCGLDFTEREALGHERPHIESPFANPLNGQGKVARKIGANTGGDGKVLEKQVAPPESIDNLRCH